MIIIGAGLAGLIAAHMLRRFDPIIFESQSSLPNNHHALLRFRSDAVSKAVGIPFKRVRVQKAICYNDRLHDRSSIRWNNMYSAKVSGAVMERSIINLEPGERFIAPPDLISRLAEDCNIQYGVNWAGFKPSAEHEPIVSTIPMPALMKLADWQEPPQFSSQRIWTMSTELDGVDVYQTLYYPGTEMYYRASITGNKLMIESQSPSFSRNKHSVNDVLGNFGISITRYNGAKVECTSQEYGKIVPIVNSIRKQFILAMSDKYNIYSLGRFATWRQILLDDLIKDVELIDSLITERSTYSAHLIR